MTSSLPLQKLTPGTLLLGAVLEIHEYEVIFSLPFNMRGSVAISDVSDPITQLVESEAERGESEEEERVSDWVEEGRMRGRRGRGWRGEL